MTLSDHIMNQHAQLNLLVELLDRELHLISTREPETLVELVNKKSELLDLIQQTDVDISEALKSSKVLSEDEQKAIDDMVELVKVCQHKTATNEKAVELGQLKLAHLRQLIVDARAKESLTYDKSGLASGSGSGKSYSA